MFNLIVCLETRQSAFRGTGPLPHPASHSVSWMGSRVGERAGAASKLALSQVSKHLIARIAAAFLGGSGIAFAAAAAPILVLGPHAEACAPGAGKPAILVKIEGLKQRAGTLRVQSYGGDPESYFEKGAYIERVEIRPPASGAVEVCLPVPRPGTYAVSVKHDLDSGGGWSLKNGGGFSGNPNMSAMDALFKRKPSPAQVQVAVRGGVTQVPVIVRYLQGSL